MQPIITSIEYVTFIWYVTSRKRSAIMEEIVLVNKIEYKILRLLGKGKGGYSYLAECDGKQVVLKQIHHEPCAYYNFGNKIQSEINDYHRLKEIGIRMPEMFDVDIENERIIKEYIDGPTIYDLVKDGIDVSDYIKQVETMCTRSYEKNTNIDYFPTNFVVSNSQIYYIDFECNNYMEEWNFANWGIKYWSQTPEFLEYVNNHK